MISAVVWAKLFLSDYRYISWRRHASDKSIERYLNFFMPWLRETGWQLGTWWDVWYVTDSGFGRKQQESERDTEDQIEKNERPKKEMSHCDDNFTVVMSPHRNLLESIKSRILEQTGDKNPSDKELNLRCSFLPRFYSQLSGVAICKLCACVWIMFWCGPQEVVYCVSPLLDVSVYWITQGAARLGGTRCWPLGQDCWESGGGGF